ncbi:MAG: pseudaminic acid synthase, partial [Candidatus Magasanikbacteria bacterium]|nr:pseudaminic acid synthase [Candidatus Magasanikbacteria bacterium]
MKTIKLATPRGERLIGPGQPTFVVAEMSGNHGGDLATAVAIIEAVAKAGADAIKLQTYTPDTMTIRSDQEWFRVGGNTPETWQGKTLYELYERAATPWDWHAKLQAIAYKLGLVFFSTPFDNTAVDFLETLRVPCYKIASYEATDLPLLERVGATKKPVIMSVGFANEAEIRESLRTLRSGGASEIALLHCATSYTAASVSGTEHLANLADLAERFGVVVGFSDNSGGIEVPLQAAILGASIIEKHIVLDHQATGPDTKFSLDPNELARLVDSIRGAESRRGFVQYGPANEEEEYTARFRRSLFVVASVRRGDMFTSENVRSIRPGFGLPPKHLPVIRGSKASCDISAGTPLQWEMVAEADFVQAVDHLQRRLEQEPTRAADAVVWLQGDEFSRGERVLEIIREGWVS